MKVFVKIYSVALFVLMPFIGISQDSSIKENCLSGNNLQIFNSIVNAVKPEQNLCDTYVQTALKFLNTPYVAGSIEKDPEQLVVNLDKTDCILFVETALAVAQNIQKGIISPDTLLTTIQNSRYRNGVVDGYTSRIHYTTEWVLQQARRGVLEDITKELGGIKIENDINYMSEHFNLYKQLRNNKNNLDNIIAVENRLNENNYYRIPKDKVPFILDNLKSGDIVGFNTSINGLDISHVGIIYKLNGKTTFIHASQSAGKVIVEPTSLVEYINKIKSNNGIRIFRLLK